MACQRILNPVGSELGGNIGDSRNRKLYGTAARTNRHEHIGGGGSRQQPNRVRRRFLDSLQEHVRGALGHAFGVFHKDHAPPPNRRPILRLHHELAGIVNANADCLGAKMRKVRVRTVQHGHTALAGAASAIGRIGLFTQQCRRENKGSSPMRCPRRPGKKPGVRGAFGGCVVAQLVKRARGQNQLIPQAHRASSPIPPEVKCVFVPPLSRANSRDSRSGRTTSSTRSCTASTLPQPSTT